MVHAPWLSNTAARLETSVLREQLGAVRIEAPVFVCGLARAGSTLLLELLAQAPGFTSHRYADFPGLWTPYWWNWLRARLPLPTQTPAERAHGDRIRVTRESPEALEEIFWMRFFRARHDPDVDQVLDADAADPAFTTFYRDHLRKLLLVRVARRYLAKGNYNLARIGLLHRMFPDARFLIAVREPLAHVGSLVRQDRQFSAWGQAAPSVPRQLARSGHFEFGPHKRAENYGDAERARRITACFAAGRVVEGYAHQWAAAYGWLSARLACDDALRSACLLVRYDALCAAPRAGLQQVVAHALIAAPDAEMLVAANASRIAAPDYYAQELSAQHTQLVRTLTGGVWQRLSIAE